MIEQALRSPEATHGIKLLDLPHVQAAAIAEFGNEMRVIMDRLSNALGLMYRRLVINRYPAPEQRILEARFMYEWPQEKARKPLLLPLNLLGQRLGW